MVDIHIHHQILDLHLQILDLLVSFLDFLLKVVDGVLEVAADLIVFEVSNPIENVILGLLLKDVLLEHFVLGLQVAQLLWVPKVGLLQLEVLLFQLGDHSTVHLAEETDSGLVSFDQPVLLLFEELLQVAELLIVDRLLAQEYEVQKAHQSLRHDVAL